jgi:hypothetical protein
MHRQGRTGEWLSQQMKSTGNDVERRRQELPGHQPGSGNHKPKPEKRGQADNPQDEAFELRQRDFH